MSKVMQAQTSALSLAEFKTETGQVLDAQTVRSYLVNGMTDLEDLEDLMPLQFEKEEFEMIVRQQCVQVYSL